MAQSYEKVKWRKSRRRAYAVYHDVVKHERWVKLSVYAKLIWYELGLEYYPTSKDGRRPGNNGWIACPYNHLVKVRCVGARSTIKEALEELEWFGFIEKTFPGQFPKEPARYGLTHLDYDQHPDNRVMARKAPHNYKQHSGEPFPKRPRNSKTTVHQAPSLVTPCRTTSKNKK